MAQILTQLCILIFYTLSVFLNVITKATRIERNSKSLIDHIFYFSVNNKIETVSSGVIIDSPSDHFLTFVEIDAKKNTEKHQARFTRNFRNSIKTDFAKPWENSVGRKFYWKIVPILLMKNSGIHLNSFLTCTSL